MSGPTDRLSRLFALVPYLQNNQGIPLQHSRSEFGVSTAQIHKDIGVLWVTGTADEHGSLIDFDYSALEDEGLIFIRDAEFEAAGASIVNASRDAWRPMSRLNAVVSYGA